MPANAVEPEPIEALLELTIPLTHAEPESSPVVDHVASSDPVVALIEAPLIESPPTIETPVIESRPAPPQLVETPLVETSLVEPPLVESLPIEAVPVAAIPSRWPPPVPATIDLTTEPDTEPDLERPAGPELPPWMVDLTAEQSPEAGAPRLAASLRVAAGAGPEPVTARREPERNARRTPPKSTRRLRRRALGGYPSAPRMGFNLDHVN